MQWRKQWQPTPVLLPGKSHGRRRLVGCSPWGCEESHTTERPHFHFSLSCIGEGNGNPLQCSCLENPRDEGAWCAAVYGVAQSRTRLKRLSSSSSNLELEPWPPSHEPPETTNQRATRQQPSTRPVPPEAVQNCTTSSLSSSCPCPSIPSVIGRALVTWYP